MPREVISNPNGPFHVGVGWHRGDSLQVGIVTDEPSFTIDGEGDEKFKSVWSDMNRHQVNDLIRLLRRARDQTFGRDE